ncbi:guanine-1-methyltransferase-domain-containing protein [Blakeslea trispora]|nr:guanine-1-methyltransferase-domain-containing protein [Blakeslea trispora]
MAENTTETLDNSNIRYYQGKKYDITEPRFQGLSKNAIKKLLKDEIYEEGRTERNKEKRERFKRKRAERRQLEKEGAVEPSAKKAKAKHMTVGNIGIVLDCSFSSLMMEKEIASLRQQIGRCYAANVRAKKESMKMTLTSLDNTLETVMDDKSPSWKNWRYFEATSEDYLDRFKKEDLVYLTADSDQVAEELEEGKTYIIGGIVDKNRYKSLCYDKAVKEGIKTARLPIGEYIRLSTRKVLTVNQVVEIMVNWLDCRDWQKAFIDAIPERKLKDCALVQDSDEEEEEEEEEEAS